MVRSLFPGAELDALVMVEYRDGEDPVLRVVREARLGIGGSRDVRVTVGAARDKSGEGDGQSLQGVKSGPVMKGALVEPPLL
ncbi:hypothetical protein MMC22_006214 [Lobaria immixta]|nr:hypothetical protein [Lobaria immixta]